MDATYKAFRVSSDSAITSIRRGTVLLSTARPAHDWSVADVRRETVHGEYKMIQKSAGGAGSQKATVQVPFFCPKKNLYAP